MGDLGDTTCMPRNGHRLILFPFPLQGHISSMLQLADILYSRGFSITVIHTEFNSPSPLRFPHFTFRSIPDGLPSEGNLAADVKLVPLMCALNVNSVEPFRACLMEMLKSTLESSKDRIACLITDSVWHFSQRIADELHIRRMELRTASTSCFSAFSTLPVLHRKGYLSIQDRNVEEPIVDRLSPLRSEDLPVVKTDYPADLHRLIEAMIKELKTSSGLIANSFEELEPAKLTEHGVADVPVPVFSIGPFHKYSPASSSSLLKQDRSSLLWLDKQAPNSVLYVSFGSLASIDPALFQEMAWGLLDSEQSFLWVVRPGLVNGLDLLPKGFSESIEGRGVVVEWASQQEVLAHPAVGGFWTHCGWNSTLESISEGVPMICTPLFGDQKVNARFINHVWRVGLQLEDNAKRAHIKSAIRRLMVSDEGEEIRDRVINLKEKVNCCLKPGGSSYNALQRLTAHLLSF